MTHIARGSGVCLLNCIIRVPPLSEDELSTIREIDSSDMSGRISSGLHKHYADVPAMRGFGPLWPILSLTGEVLAETDNRHPFGPQKKKDEKE